MGIGLIRGNFDCQHQQVTAQLDQVFATTGTPKYHQARQAANEFAHAQTTGLWHDLLAAYIHAGVDVGPELSNWILYLKKLGESAQGTQWIKDIAGTRYNALTSNGVITTTTLPSGSPVEVTATTIKSPCPPP